jgi:hypothetical protein
LSKVAKADMQRVVLNQPSPDTMAKQRILEGQLSKLAELIRAGYSREQARKVLRISDEGLDALLSILQNRAARAKARSKPPTNLFSPRTLTAKRVCQKCGENYTLKTGGTKKLCGTCYERQRQKGGPSIQAVPTAFESNHGRH